MKKKVLIIGLVLAFIIVTSIILYSKLYSKRPYFIGRAETVFVGTENGLIQILHQDKDKYWHLKGRALEGRVIHDIAFNPNVPTILYAATNQGVYLSEDGGSTWTLVAEQFGKTTDTEIHPLQPNTLYAASYEGLIKSQDRGKTWQVLFKTDETPYLLTAISVNKNNPDVLYVGTSALGVLVSRDGGATWKTINSGLPRSIGAAPISPVEAIVSSPKDPLIVFAALEVYGIYRSRNGGQEWTRLSKGLPSPFDHRSYPTTLAISPTDENLMYAVMSEPISSESIDNGVYKSKDGGESWNKVQELDGPAKAIRIRPDNSVEVITRTSVFEYKIFVISADGSVSSFNFSIN